jgi:hypothetical protein
MVRMPEDNPVQQYKDRAEEEREIDREVKKAYNRLDGNFYGEVSKLSQKYGTGKVQESVKRLRRRGALTKNGPNVLKDGEWE